jgi:CDP-diacylglycerol--serine O-phosphatidyltransferase
MLQIIPNALTSANLFCGCLGILFAVRDDWRTAAFLTIAAAFFDFFDGFAARALKVKSDIGKELDSLADCVTFGVLPAFVLFKMLENRPDLPFAFAQYCAFAIAIFSALRLAKFNVDTRQSDRFIGVPTPANALIWVSLPFLVEKNIFLSELVAEPIFLLILCALMCFLMNAEIPLLALKFKNYGFKDNFWRYLLIFTSVGIIAFWGFAGVFFAVIAYIFLSLISNQFSKKQYNEIQS